ncbi:MAG: flagellar FliJ family protein [Pyrinomonadaceae bacterium]
MPKQEKYNLQRLLEMRERLRDDAALYLAECRRQLTLAEIELTNREQAVENCRQEQKTVQTQMIEKSESGIKSSEIVRYRQHLADLRELETKLLAAVEEQKRAVERAAKTAEKALDALREKSKEAKVIEKHRENWRSERKSETARREQKSNDEIGAILHERQRFE